MLAPHSIVPGSHGLTSSSHRLPSPLNPSSRSIKCRFCRLLTSATSIGLSKDTDDTETQRMRRVMLVVHYVFFMCGPITNILLFLASSMPYPALCTFLVAGIPPLCSYFAYCYTHNLWAGIYAITLIPLISPSLITILAGGVFNSGYVAQLTFTSPLFWLCITRRCRPAVILFALASTFTVLHVIFADRLFDLMVNQAGLASRMPPEIRGWHWWIHLIQMKGINLMLYGYVLAEVTRRITTETVLRRRLEHIAHKLADLDLDDIPTSLPSATEPDCGDWSGSGVVDRTLEACLLAVVDRMRVWKPYIPLSLFLMEDESPPPSSSRIALDGPDAPISQHQQPPPNPNRNPLQCGVNQFGLPAPAVDHLDQNTFLWSSSPDRAPFPASSSSLHGLSLLNSEKDHPAIQTPTSSGFRPKDQAGVAAGASSSSSALPPVSVVIRQITHSRQPSQQHDSHHHRRRAFSNISTPSSTGSNSRAAVAAAGIVLSPTREGPTSPFPQYGAGDVGFAEGDCDWMTSVIATSAVVPYHLSQKPHRATSKSSPERVRTEVFLHDKRATMGFLQVNNFIPSAAVDIQETRDNISNLLNVTSTIVRTEKGAVHQFVGDRVVCVWTGANHQIRACTAILQIRASLTGPTFPTVSYSQCVAAITSGPMFVGNVGSHQRMPVFCGPPQDAGWQLLSLTSIIQASILVDQNVATQVDHQFDLLPVDLVQGLSGWKGTTSPTTIYEIFRTARSRNSLDRSEWMYEIHDTNRTTTLFKEKFVNAFGDFANGRFSAASLGFVNLLTSSVSSDSSPPTVANESLRREQRPSTQLQPPVSECPSSSLEELKSSLSSQGGGGGFSGGFGSGGGASPLGSMRAHPAVQRHLRRLISESNRLQNALFSSSNNPNPSAGGADSGITSATPSIPGPVVFPSTAGEGFLSLPVRKAMAWWASEYVLVRSSTESTSIDEVSTGIGPGS